jgi:precorrin-2 methylase
MFENKILLQKGSNSRDLIRNYLTKAQTTVCHVVPVTRHNAKNIFFYTKVSNYFQHFLSDLQMS